jgi:hypothetical protein
VTPLETPQFTDSFEKHVRDDVLGVLGTVHAIANIRVYTRKVVVVEVYKSPWVCPGLSDVLAFLLW